MKKIAIIGGGISGLAVLHYLKQRFPDIEIVLYESSSQVGGSIATLENQGFLFETGPNGFLTNQPNTLEFLKEIGFNDQLIEADASSSRRYVQINGRLHLLPMDPISFIKTPLLTMRQKFRLLKGFLITDISKDQSVYDYTSKRFGPAVTDRFVDPFLSGVHAGDIKRLHMKSVFLKLSHRRGKAKLCSFKQGMGSLIAYLFKRYKAFIQTGVEIKSLDEIKADLFVVATPAYVTASLVKLDSLNQIYYSPIAVVGLAIKKSSFKKQPDGFGYLIPSTEGKEVLGVLLESNVFKRSSQEDLVFIRVMLGGRHHPEIAIQSQEQLIAKAIKEIDTVYGLKDQPQRIFIKLWAKAIPQYELNYSSIREDVRSFLERRPNLFLCANYLDGISFNDCIYNAKSFVAHLPHL